MMIMTMVVIVLMVMNVVEVVPVIAVCARGMEMLMCIVLMRMSRVPAIIQIGMGRRGGSRRVRSKRSIGRLMVGTREWWRLVQRFHVHATHCT